MWGRLGRNIPAASSAPDAGPRAMGAFVAGTSPLASRARRPALAALTSPMASCAVPLLPRRRMPAHLARRLQLLAGFATRAAACLAMSAGAAYGQEWRSRQHAQLGNRWLKLQVVVSTNWPYQAGLLLSRVRAW